MWIQHYNYKVLAHVLAQCSHWYTLFRTVDPNQSWASACPGYLLYVEVSLRHHCTRQWKVSKRMVLSTQKALPSQLVPVLHWAVTHATLSHLVLKKQECWHAPELLWPWSCCWGNWTFKMNAQNNLSTVVDTNRLFFNSRHSCLLAPTFFPWTNICIVANGRKIPLIILFWVVSVLKQ